MIGVPTISTETQEKTELFNRYLAGELGLYTDKIVGVLVKDPNQLPFRTLSAILKNNPGARITLEKSLEIIRANAITPENKRLSYLDLTTDPDLKGSNIINKDTFDTLAQLVIDQDVAVANVNSKMEGAH